jgi:hypothetical protein
MRGGQISNGGQDHADSDRQHSAKADREALFETGQSLIQARLRQRDLVVNPLDCVPTR